MPTGSSQQIDMTNHWILRIVALIIDGVIWAIVAYIIFWALIVAAVTSGAWLFFGFYYWLLWPFVWGILLLIYFPVMEVSSGATIGKKVMGLQVQMVSGGKVTFDKALIRNLSKIYWLFLLLDWIIGIATPGPDPRQKYMDRVAGTTVVSTKQAFVPPPPPAPPPS
jgi:uncharacterized RDD family membrane protein YckC